MKEAREAGIEILPRPEVGKIFTFSLTTSDGKMLNSAGFKGKVVLIDCLATWCTPCMAKMPELKSLYARYHDAGLEVVGVNFDHGRSRKTWRRSSPSWVCPGRNTTCPILGKNSGKRPPESPRSPGSSDRPRRHPLLGWRSRCDERAGCEAVRRDQPLTVPLTLPPPGFVLARESAGIPLAMILTSGPSFVL